MLSFYSSWCLIFTLRFFNIKFSVPFLPSPFPIFITFYLPFRDPSWMIKYMRFCLREPRGRTQIPYLPALSPQIRHQVALLNGDKHRVHLISCGNQCNYAHKKLGTMDFMCCMWSLMLALSFVPRFIIKSSSLLYSHCELFAFMSF